MASNNGSSRGQPADGNRRRFSALGIGLATAGVSLALLIIGWTTICLPAKACPSIDGLDRYDADQTSKVYAADGRLLAEFGRERRTVKSLDQMSPDLVAAVLAIEDRRFYRHRGTDWIRVGGSLKALLTGRVQGFSTITMQLVGNLWPDQINRGERTGIRGIIRKLREVRVAHAIERRYSKARILELYLNQIPLGSGAFGVEVAAQRYFGKSARDVNLAEAATIAALPRAPSTYNPRRHPRQAVQRRNLILDKLREQGKLSRDSAEMWKRRPLVLASGEAPNDVGEYFVEYVRRQLESQLGSDLYTAGYKIYTTLDVDMEAAAERALEQQLSRIERDPGFRRRHPTFQDSGGVTAADDRERPSFSPYLQGALVTVEPQTGYIRAMVGGRDFGDSKFNRAVQARRQAGSTFKAFVYGAALRAGLRWSDLYEDGSTDVAVPDQPDWTPRNYDNAFDGRMTMREAFYRSRNTVAVQVGEQVGVDRVIEEATRAGIETPIPRVPSIFIGSAEVIPLEMTAAFATIANLGVKVEPVGVIRVEDHDGRTVFEAGVHSSRVMDREHAWLLLDGLRDVVRQPMGTAHRALAEAGFRLPAGGKTGTTNDAMDVWFVGFTPDLVTGVWMGFDRKQVITGNAQGGRLAAPVWAAMMSAVYRGRPAPADWPVPDGLVAVRIDRVTGYRSTDACPGDDVAVEYFYPGTEPEDCPVPEIVVDSVVAVEKTRSP